MQVTSSQIIEGKVPFDAGRIEWHFILFVPLGKIGSKYQMLLIIFSIKNIDCTCQLVFLIVNVKLGTMEKKDEQAEESSKLYKHQLVTLADLEKFKEQMLSEMRRLLAGGGKQHSKQWLKSREVRKLLDVSPGKLYAMRVSRQLSYMRIGGVIYYDRADIDKMFEKFKTSAAK